MERLWANHPHDFVEAKDMLKCYCVPSYITVNVDVLLSVAVIYANNKGNPSCVCMCMCMCVCMHVCVCVCACAWLTLKQGASGDDYNDSDDGDSEDNLQHNELILTTFNLALTLCSCVLEAWRGRVSLNRPSKL
jgi:hypothetical protein